MARFSQGFRTQSSEIEVDALPVEGSVPDWIAGSLVRVTPAQFEVGERRYRHWFDGLAMLHRFGFEDGQVSYANRYLQTPAYEDNNAAGRIEYKEFATDPCRSLFQRVVSFFTPPNFGANGNVSVTKLADDYLARTEYPMSVKFDPEVLATLGFHSHEGTDGVITSAHPHYDVRRGEDYNYQLKFGRKSSYLLYALPGGRNPRQIAELPAEKPAYVHSFGMSDQYLILVVFPLKMRRPLKFLLGNRPFIENYSWMPEDGTRIFVIDKDSGEVVGEGMTEAFFAFHHVNAFENDGDLIFDIVAYDDASIIDQLYLDNLTADDGHVTAWESSKLRRYRVDLTGSDARVSHETISQTPFELPKFDYERTAGKDYRYVYGGGTREGSKDFMNQIAKIDVKSGESATWFEDGMYPGEPVFHPRPDGDAEDAGVVLSVVLDSTKGTSFLLVLDAETFDQRARVEVPQHIPFGFHGEFFNGSAS